ncbi:TRAP transporter small permease subunit [Rhodobacter sp. NTK016B]|uniref:TRAP transporter small permease n=1 Tax=Rhodobacter sp. NTK016B TaxID=2759676 RepID=UPI001A8F36DC|nr:TRAP transporter small permease subunit [Rhodobacter sp. NTK016B]MBN8293572.1 TRAP transporter small permease subunit [Rhodobacter sp. NTK016B]
MIRSFAQALARGLERVSGALNVLAIVGAVLAVLVMVYAAGWQVIARYVLSSPPIWTEELSRRAMVWAGMLGASVAFRAGADPVLFPNMVAMRGKLGGLLATLRALGVVIFATPILWYCFFGPNMNIARGFLGRSMSRTAEMIPVSMIWFTAAVPIAFILILIHVAASLSMQATGQAPARAPAEPGTPDSPLPEPLGKTP